MKEFEVEFKIRNNRLKERRVALGLSAPKLCKKLDLPYNSYIHLENLHPRGTPFVRPRSGRSHYKGKVDDWKPWIKKLASFYKITPSELFPESVFAIEANRVTKKIDGSEIAPLLSGTCDKLLPAEVCEDTEGLLIKREEIENILNLVDTKLTPRERRVIMWRTGLNDEDELTLNEIGEKYNLSRERIRGIEEEGYRKIRSKVKE